MLTVRATLQPNGQVQLPLALAKDKPVPVLVTILEPPPEAAASSPVDENGLTGKGSVANLLALLRSPEFLAIPRADPQEVEERIRGLRNDWDDE
jgi:hypothetical protein